jgi:uracil-DNA glycosylase family 4
MSEETKPVDIEDDENDFRHHSLKGTCIGEAGARCTFCPLRYHAKSIRVDGRGSDSPVIMLVGEAPGWEEDMEGKPFVGRSGKFLEEILANLNLSFGLFRYENAVRCIPKDSMEGKFRKPTYQEVIKCSSYLWWDIDKYDPEVIVALGATPSAAFGLLGPKMTGITKIRGQTKKVDIFGKTRLVVPTFHPSAILRSGEYGVNREIAFREDLLLASRKAGIRPGGAKVPVILRKTPEWRLLNDTDEAITYLLGTLAKFREGEIDSVAFDIETTCLDAYADKDLSGNPPRFLGFGMSYKTGEAVYIPMEHGEIDGHEGSKVDVDRLRNVLEIFLNEVPVICHNALFDVGFTSAHYNINTIKVKDDTLLLSFMIYAGDGTHSLAKCAERDLNSDEWKGGPTDYLNKKYRLNKDKHFGNTPLPMLAEYCAYDVEATYALREIYRPRLEEVDLEVAYNRWMVALGVFSEMERRGAFVDLEYLEEKEKLYPILLKEVLEELREDPLVRTYEEMNSRDFNPANYRHVRWLLFEDGHKLPEPPEGRRAKNVQKVKTGVSTDDAAIIATYNRCKEEGNLVSARTVRLIREYRKIAKMITGQFNVIRKHQRSGTYNIATHWSMHSASGRFRASNFSIHTVPKDSDSRRTFVSEWHGQGGLLLHADYSQMEMRILACLSGDESLINAYLNGEDVHKFMATKVFNKPLDKITKEERQYAKSTNFGIAYGMSYSGLAKELGVPVEKAKQIMDDYFDRLPMIKGWVDTTHEGIKKEGYVRIPTGRMRWLPKAFSGNYREKQEACREGLNTIIQGAASDICLQAVLFAQEELVSAGLKSRCWCFTHDSVFIDVYPGELLEVTDIAKRCLEERVLEVFPWITLPLEIDIDLGARWSGTVSVGSFDLDKGIFDISGKLPHFQDLMFQSGKSGLYSIVADSGLFETEVLEDKETEKREKEDVEMIKKEAYKGDNGGLVTCKTRIEYIRMGN